MYQIWGSMKEKGHRINRLSEHSISIKQGSISSTWYTPVCLLSTPELDASPVTGPPGSLLTDFPLLYFPAIIY